MQLKSKIEVNEKDTVFQEFSREKKLVIDKLLVSSIFSHSI